MSQSPMMQHINGKEAQKKIDDAGPMWKAFMCVIAGLFAVVLVAQAYHALKSPATPTNYRVTS